MISVLRCPLRSPLPLLWAGPRASQWIAQLYSLCSQGGMLCYAALSGFLRRYRALAAMLFWAAISDGYGGFACCVQYSLEFFFWGCDADCLFGSGEHSALAGSVLC